MADPAALAFLEKVELRGEGDLDTIRALLLEALAEVRGADSRGRRATALERAAGPWAAHSSPPLPLRCRAMRVCS